MLPLPSPQSFLAIPKVLLVRPPQMSYSLLLNRLSAHLSLQPMLSRLSGVSVPDSLARHPGLLPHLSSMNRRQQLSLTDLASLSKGQWDLVRQVPRLCSPVAARRAKVNQRIQQGLEFLTSSKTALTAAMALQIPFHVNLSFFCLHLAPTDRGGRTHMIGER